MRRRFSFKASFTLRGRESYGIRGWAGKPIHPPLTDFPIAGYVLAAAFDAVSLYSAANGLPWAHEAFVAGTWTMIAAAAVSVLTALTGLLDWPATTKGTQVRRTVNAHALVMVTVTLLAAITVLLRVEHWPGAAGTTSLIAALSAAVAVLVVVGAWLGSDLVFEHGFRVEPARDTPAWNRNEVDILPGGQAVVPRRWSWAKENGAQPEAPARRPVAAERPRVEEPPLPIGHAWRTRAREMTPSGRTDGGQQAAERARWGPAPERQAQQPSRAGDGGWTRPAVARQPPVVAGRSSPPAEQGWTPPAQPSAPPQPPAAQSRPQPHPQPRKQPLPSPEVFRKPPPEPAPKQPTRNPALPPPEAFQKGSPGEEARPRTRNPALPPPDAFQKTPPAPSPRPAQGRNPALPPPEAFLKVKPPEQRQPHSEMTPRPAAQNSPATDHGDDGEDAIRKLRQLAELQGAGVITPREFEQKKAELLSRI